MTGVLEARPAERRDPGGAGVRAVRDRWVPGVDATLLRRLADAGADAIEVGIPFSDPVMDGGVIQAASAEALRAGVRPADVVAQVRDAAVDVPVAVMTYVNPMFRRGLTAAVEEAAEAGVTGLIVPDLPVDESGELEALTAAAVDLVLLAAPGTAEGRLSEIGRRSRGFVYCVATYGVTGARDRLEGTAKGSSTRSGRTPTSRCWSAWGSGRPPRRRGLRVRRRRGGRERADGAPGRGGRRRCGGSHRRSAPPWPPDADQGIPGPRMRRIPLGRPGETVPRIGETRPGCDSQTRIPGDREEKGGLMKQRRWFTTLALVAVLAIVAAACADDGGAEGDGGRSTARPSSSVASK